MTSDAAFYEVDGERFVPSVLTRGPWSEVHQHGGPPSALVARAAERFGASVDDAASWHVARLTLEFLRPVPLAPLGVRAVRAGGGCTAERLALEVDAGGEVVMRASALRLRRRAVPVPAEAAGVPLDVAPPDTLTPFYLPFFRWDEGYHRAVEVRFAEGGWGDRAVTLWMRPLVPLVAGEAPSPLERTLAVVDAESGVCPPVDVARFTFLNPDLTALVERPCEGAWCGMRVRSAAYGSGIGLAESQLFDSRGTFGRAAQTLVVSER